MRIIGGHYRGAILTAPTGEQTRPTLDRVRENLFNILGNAPYVQRIMGGHVMDIFAGSGALGLEAYSRGATHITFVENHPNALLALRQNINKVKAENNTTILKTNASNMPLNTGNFPDIIMMDAPYHKNLHEPTLNSLYENNWIGHKTILVLQQSPTEPLYIPPWTKVVKDKTYGKGTRFIILTVTET